MDESELEFRFNKAAEYQEEGKFLHAIQIYSQLSNFGGYKRESCIQLHKIYESMGKIYNASKILKDFLAEFPDDFDLRKYYSLFLIKNSMYEEAEGQLSFLSTNEIPEVKFLSGIARFFLKEFETASINFADFLEQNKSSDYCYDAYIYLAKTYLELNEIDKALEAARKADNIYSSDDELQLVLTKIYLLKGMNFHAFDAVSKGLRLNNESRQMNELAGRILFEIGEYEKAENHLNKIADGSEQPDEIFTLLGIIYFKKNNHDKASEMFAKALELNPGNSLAAKSIKACSEIMKNKNVSQ